MTDTFRARLAQLDEPARQALDTVAAYYLEQVRPEVHDGTIEELATALAETRQALDCRVFTAELPAASQAQLLASSPASAISASDDPEERAGQVDAVLQDTALDLFELLATAERADGPPATTRPPDYELLRAGDRVIVRAPHRPQYALNGHTGTFQRYTDPRIGHDARSAQVHLDGEPDDCVSFVIPAFLDFEREDIEDESPLRAVWDYQLEDETWEEQEAARRFNPARPGLTSHPYHEKKSPISYQTTPIR